MKQYLGELTMKLQAKGQILSVLSELDNCVSIQIESFKNHFKSDGLAHCEFYQEFKKKCRKYGGFCYFCDNIEAVCEKKKKKTGSEFK